jgi:hypothetical protein
MSFKEEMVGLLTSVNSGANPMTDESLADSLLAMMASWIAGELSKLFSPPMRLKVVYRDHQEPDDPTELVIPAAASIDWIIAKLAGLGRFELIAPGARRQGTQPDADSGLWTAYVQADYD